MAYVPRGAPKGKKSKEQFHNIDVDDIDVDSIDMAGLEIVAGATETVVDSTLDLTIKLPGHAATDLFTIEDDASHERLQVDGAGKVTVGGKLVIPYGHHTGILIDDLQATFGDPATLDDGFTAVYKDDTTAKIYTVHVVGDAFYLHEAAAAAAA